MIRIVTSVRALPSCARRRSVDTEGRFLEGTLVLYLVYRSQTHRCSMHQIHRHCLCLEQCFVRVRNHRMQSRVPLQLQQRSPIWGFGSINCDCQNPSSVPSSLFSISKTEEHPTYQSQQGKKPRQMTPERTSGDHEDGSDNWADTTSGQCVGSLPLLRLLLRRLAIARAVTKKPARLRRRGLVRTMERINSATELYNGWQLVTTAEEVLRWLVRMVTGGWDTSVASNSGCVGEHDVVTPVTVLRSGRRCDSFIHRHRMPSSFDHWSPTTPPP